MKLEPTKKRLRDVVKLALFGLRMGLAIVFLMLGCFFLFGSEIATDLTRAGIDPIFRLILGVLHLFGGLALLVPSLARKAVFGLGLLVAGSAFYLLSQGVGIRLAGPGSLVLGLLIFTLCQNLRQRLDALAWSETLSRYADEQDWLHSNQSL
jgi:uncharacterized membrane protein YphA (DoxX/SURF4 family)